MSLPKRIGFVDYKLENYHANVYLALLRNELRDRGFVVGGAWAMDQENGRTWASANNVEYFDNPAKLNEHVDFYVILAPGNPETHLELCQKFFPFGKMTYVDKVFAPDLATAKTIFALADKHRIKIQTTSALRYTNVQAYVRGEAGGAANVRHMITWGGGRSFDEYAIHAVELLISCMGPGATRLMRRGTGDQSQLLIDFTDGRTGVANVYCNADTPFAATVTTAKQTRHIAVDAGKIFLDAAAAQLDLFESGKESIDRAETLMIRRILDAASDRRALDGFVAL